MQPPHHSDKEKNKKVGRAKKDPIRSNIINNEPVFGPFSLGPSTIFSKTNNSRSTSMIPTPLDFHKQQQKQIFPSLQVNVMNNSKQPHLNIGNSDDNIPYEGAVSDLNDLQHLNAGAGMEDTAINNASTLSSSQESLVLVQLPFILPGVEPEYLAQQLAAVKLTPPSQTTPSQEELEKRARTAILNEPSIDGKIGKIKIYRSGKVMLFIGSIGYMVSKIIIYFLVGTRNSDILS